GGSIVISAAGALTLDGSDITAVANCCGTFNGGKISLTGSTLTMTSLTGLRLDASAISFGNGGSISVAATADTADITVDQAQSALRAFATGGQSGSPSGDGGSISVKAGHTV